MRHDKRPRQGRFYGEPIINNIGANDTWLEGEEFCYPSGAMLRRARVLCPDAKLRIVRCGCADTFFSIPAVAVINGKRTKGFIMSHENQFEFHPYTEVFVGKLS